MKLRTEAELWQRLRENYVLSAPPCESLSLHVCQDEVDS